MNPFIGSLFKFLALIASLFLSVSAFGGPPAGVLDDTHVTVQAVMLFRGEVTPELMQSRRAISKSPSLFRRTADR